MKNLTPPKQRILELDDPVIIRKNIFLVKYELKEANDMIKPMLSYANKNNLNGELLRDAKALKDERDALSRKYSGTIFFIGKPGYKAKKTALLLREMRKETENLLSSIDDFRAFKFSKFFDGKNEPAK